MLVEEEMVVGGGGGYFFFFSYAVDTNPLRSGNTAHVCTKGGGQVIWKIHETRSPNNETLLIPPRIIQHALIDGC